MAPPAIPTTRVAGRPATARSPEGPREGGTIASPSTHPEGPAISPDAPEAEPDPTDDVREPGEAVADDTAIVGVGTPPVVAVVVTRDPGPWFTETLRGLERQDYADLSVLVVDNASSQDPAPTVAEVLPRAFVKRMDRDQGFSAAASTALDAVEGAPFLLFLHDDVRLDPAAVTTLVAEAFRSNAGVVGPKLVAWDDDTTLRSVGLAVDAYGASAELVDPGELDQGQHDIARPVFAVSSACVLVRADLMGSLGGFSRDLPFYGEDVDLCWRAHLAGATVQFCPRARASHRGRFADRRDVDDADRHRLRHQGRMVLGNSSGRRLVKVLPVLAVLVLVDLVGSVVSGRFRRAGDVLSALAWTVPALPGILRARAANRKVRRVPDSDFEQLVHAGSYRIRSLVRSDEGENRLAVATRSGRDYVRGLTTPSSRVAAALLAAAVLVAVLGARGLLTGPVVSIRELVGLGGDGGSAVSQWWTGWRPVALGEPAVAPGVLPVAGGAAWLLGGAVRFIGRLVVLVPLLAGGIGAWKLFARSGSGRARTAALAAYALNPVALNAVATGRLQALVAYAAAPWLLRRVAANAAVEPFGRRSSQRTPLVRHLAGDALLLGAVAWVTPLGAAVLAASVAVLAVGVVAGRQLGAAGLALRSLGGLVLSVPLWLPWLVAAVRHGDAATLTGVWTTRAALPSAADLLTGNIGPVRPGVLGWGLLVAAAVPLLTGRSWRLGWAVGGWVLMLCSWGGTVLLARSGLVGGAGVELFLVPAALGAAVSVAMGPLAFEEDVVAGDFGAPQLLSGVALAALVVWLVPIGVASANGRWYQPAGDYERALRAVDDGTDFRTVWVGDPDVLPVAGWQLAGSTDLAVGVTSGLDPALAQRFRLDGGTGGAALRRAVAAALDGRTSRLGALLAPMGVRYLVVVDRPAPQPFAGRTVPLPRGAVAALEEQLDLARLPLSPGASLFRTSGAWPLRSDVQGLDLPLVTAPAAARSLAALPVPPAVFPRGGGTSFTGPLPGGARVAQSVTADPGWRLAVGDRTARRLPALGWSQQFAAGGGSSAQLRFDTPWSARALQAVQVLSLVLVLVVLGRRRLVAGPGGGRRRRVAPEPAAAVVVVAPSTGAPVPPIDGPEDGA